MKNCNILIVGAAVTLVLSLSACGQAEEAISTAETSPTPEVASQTEIDAYRERISTATDRSIASVVMAAPNEELRAEAKACMAKHRAGESCVDG